MIFGYGNPDRQDDGVAWHILCALAKRLKHPIPKYEEGISLFGSNPALFFSLQLTPEVAEVLAEYHRVCFIDAHTGSIPEEIKLTNLIPGYQPSPLTHHTTPQTCLALAKTLYNSEPEAILVSVRGFDFHFSRDLSAGTKKLVPLAEHIIWSWFIEEL